MRETEIGCGSADLNMVDQFITTYDETKLDRYFSIPRTGVNRYMMGDKNVLWIKILFFL